MTRPTPATLARVMAVTTPRLLATIKTLQDAIKADERAKDNGTQR